MEIGASLTSSLDLGGSYDRVWVVVPAGTPQAADTYLFVQGSINGTTYFRTTYVVPNTSTVALNDFRIVSNTTSRIVPVPNFGFQYIRLEATAVATAAGAYKIVCGD